MERQEKLSSQMPAKDKFAREEMDSERNQGESRESEEQNSLQNQQMNSDNNSPSHLMSHNLQQDTRENNALIENSRIVSDQPSQMSQ
mmetsp:Transcript_725/g.1332  ORF Transcript_725/g.1332 Transcript_725/m.1332 type:complete len:87 (+) Transcript_725:160-420(+)